MGASSYFVQCEAILARLVGQVLQPDSWPYPAPVLSGQKLEGLLVQWALAQQELDFHIVYCKGMLHENAEALSRQTSHCLNMSTATTCVPHSRDRLWHNRNVLHIQVIWSPQVQRDLTRSPVTAATSSTIWSTTVPTGHFWWCGLSSICRLSLSFLPL